MIIFILSQSVENGEERRGHKRERLVKRHEMMVACTMVVAMGGEWT